MSRERSQGDRSRQAALEENAEEAGLSLTKLETMSNWTNPRLCEYQQFLTELDCMVWIQKFWIPSTEVTF
ncbi:unnamed protein product [Caenorhabditis nigoni]